MTNLHAIISEIPDETMNPQCVYRLGPAFTPAHVVRSGPLWNTPVWCMLDTLFTSETIEEARTETKGRMERNDGIAPF